MKFQLHKYSILALGLTLFSTFAVGQIETIEFTAPDHMQVWDRIEKEAYYEGKDLVGVILEQQVDFFEFASHEVLADGVNQWTLNLKSEDAQGLSVYFNDFHVPVGGELYMESPEGAFETIYQEGPVDHTENNDHGKWASGDIPGEIVTVIYRQPSSVVGNARLGIMGLGYFVKGVTRGSDECQVDVMCPEGDSWQCERDGAVRLRVTQNGGIYYCSGSMVNNTNLDCRQLMLSAFHCADSVGDDEWGYFKVRYNYEYIECGGTTSVNSHTRTGVILLTSSDDATSQGFSGSDFLLVEVEDPILESWNPFYAGWDATGTTGQSGVGIHHPSGDRKKISTYSSALINSSIGNVGSHWKVYWVITETNHGVTEGGSSGSPIYNQNHHIVGTLSSGASACVNGGAGPGTGPYAPDYYGKMSYHWDGNNPIPEQDKLKYFLDPENTGQETLHGSYVGTGDTPCGGFGACDDTEVSGTILEGMGWTISPNPAANNALITMPHGAPLSEIRIYDASGRLVESITPGEVEYYTLDVSEMSSGLHYLTVRTTDGTSSTQKLIVE